MGVKPHIMLGGALEAALAALRELDGDQIPNDLRRVVAASGSLPAPLAQSLLRGLEKYEWLREQAAGRLDDGSEGRRSEAAALYLSRPEGWELRLAGLYADEAATALSAADRNAEQRERQLADALKAAKEKVKAVQKEAAAGAARLEARIGELTSERKTAAAAGSKGEEAVRKRLEEAEAELAATRKRLESALGEARAAKEARKEERAERRRIASEAAESASGAAWAADSASLAARLDETALMAQAPTVGAYGAAPVEGSKLSIPSGVAPDGKRAVDWLLGAGRATVIVDGYNLGFLLLGEKKDPSAARARVMPPLQRLHSAGRGDLKVVVVFDSDVGPAESPVGPGPVAVRYSHAGETADDDIVRLAGEIAGPVVVVSNDRAVRDRSETEGAVALWSNALAAWAGSR